MTGVAQLAMYHANIVKRDVMQAGNMADIFGWLVDILL